jgi:MFS family permease
MGDPATPLWGTVLLAPVLTWAFVRWERRTIRRGGAPLLDVTLFREAPGYASGIVLATVYFCGFSGIWLVLALFLQDGLHFTPFESGLAVTPFAVGSATSSVLAGRLVERFGRWVTVVGVALVATGFAAVAVVVPATLPAHPALVLLGPLLVAGLGSGAVISPNITMTLSAVPPHMGGAAGGALQTGQRIGSAVGAAVLAATYRISAQAVAGLGLAVTVTFGCALVFVSVALGLAVRELRASRRDEPTRECREQADVGAS